jgi:hypothetical protein
MSQIPKMARETRFPQVSGKGDPATLVSQMAIALSQWVFEVAWRINRLIDGDFGLLQLEVQHAEPNADIIKKGMIAYADGTDWDPGSGEGPYFYNGSAWTAMF